MCLKTPLWKFYLYKHEYLSTFDYQKMHNELSEASKRVMKEAQTSYVDE